MRGPKVARRKELAAPGVPGDTFSCRSGTRFLAFRNIAGAPAEALFNNVLHGAKRSGGAGQGCAPPSVLWAALSLRGRERTLPVKE